MATVVEVVVIVIFLIELSDLLAELDREFLRALWGATRELFQL
jgi:hypothetical protein